MSTIGRRLRADTPKHLDTTPTDRRAGKVIVEKVIQTLPASLLAGQMIHKTRDYDVTQGHGAAHVSWHSKAA